MWWHLVSRAKRSQTKTWTLVTIQLVWWCWLRLNTSSANTIQHCQICCVQQCWAMLHPFKRAFTGRQKGVNGSPPLYFWHHSSDWLDIWHIYWAFFVLSIDWNHVLPNWFPWQPQQHNDVTNDRQLGFSNSNLNTENSEKRTFSDWNLQNCKIHCKIIII